MPHAALATHPARCVGLGQCHTRLGPHAPRVRSCFSKPWGEALASSPPIPTPRRGRSSDRHRYDAPVCVGPMRPRLGWGWHTVCGRFGRLSGRALARRPLALRHSLTFGARQLRRVPLRLRLYIRTVHLSPLLLLRRLVGRLLHLSLRLGLCPRLLLLSCGLNGGLGSAIGLRLLGKRRPLRPVKRLNVSLPTQLRRRGSEEGLNEQGHPTQSTARRQ